MARLLRTAAVLLTAAMLLAAGAALAVFLTYNAQWVVVRVPVLTGDWSRPFASNEYESPLAAVMLASAAAGAAVATLLLLPSWLRRAVERRRERRFIGELEGELADLRTLPVERPAPLEDLGEQQPEGLGPEPADAGDEESGSGLAAHGGGRGPGGGRG